MLIKKTEVTGFEAAFRSMRNPLESWNRSDSEYWLPNKWQDEYEEIVGDDIDWTPYHLGENDKTLAKKLCDGGEPHRKFLRYIHVSADITASQTYWSQYDTYKIGTTANSTSKMHKLATTPITLDRFEMDDYEDLEWDDNHSDFIWERLIETLEKLRLKYLETKDKRYWNELIRLLPMSWLQTRTVDLNYEVIRTMYYWRKDHKLNSWRTFCNWVKDLPYAGLLLIENNK